MRRALVVGIDNYQRLRSLSGCVNDARAVAPLLAHDQDGAPNFEVKTLVAPQGSGSVTRDQLLGSLKMLLGPGVEMSMFYFAGHGSQSGPNGDVWLVTSDATADTPGVKFAEVLELVASCPQEVAIILDCCFSGGAGSVPAALSAGAVLRQGVSILTASRADQTAAETATGRGQFSLILEGALDGGAADVLGHVTVAGLYSYLSEAFGAWDQRPTFKANVDRLQDIRACQPSVPLRALRQLAEWFPAPESVFALDPSYEPTAEPHDPAHEAVFAQLQRCVWAKLIEPVGATPLHMYYAAIQSKGCQLTPLGRHYRQLSAEGRV